MKTSFKTRVIMGFYFCYEILFYLVSSYSPFLSNLLNQNLQNVKTPKRKLESFVQRYSFKFRAQDYQALFIQSLLLFYTKALLQSCPHTSH